MCVRQLCLPPDRPHLLLVLELQATVIVLVPQSTRTPLLPLPPADVLGNALHLAHDQYGNYVVQHLVTKGPEAARWGVAAWRCARQQAWAPLPASQGHHAAQGHAHTTCTVL